MPLINNINLTETLAQAKILYEPAILLLAMYIGIQIGLKLFKQMVNFIKHKDADSLSAEIFKRGADSLYATSGKTDTTYQREDAMLNELTQTMSSDEYPEEVQKLELASFKDRISDPDVKASIKSIYDV